MHIGLISQILRSVWLMDTQASIGYIPMIASLLGESKVVFEFDAASFKPSAVSALDSSQSADLSNAGKGSVAIIPINGPLMKDDQSCGPIGMATIGKYIQQADNDPNIMGIILHMDTPGGTHTGTMDLARIVADTKKPVVAFVDGMVASAGLWIASNTNEIIASNNRVELGSIGVQLTFQDLQPYFEKQGVKFHSIVSDLSPDKNKVFQDIQEGKYDEYKKTKLNPLAQDFTDVIKANRANVKEEHLTGKMFFAQDVMGVLVDHIGNMDFAIQRVRELAAAVDNQIDTQSTNTKSAMNLKPLNSLLGTDLQVSEDGVFLNEEMIDQVSASIESNAQLTTDLETANGNLTTANEELTQANATIETLNNELAELRKAPGAPTATVVTQKETAGPKGKAGNVTSDNKSFMENLDAVSEEFGL